MTPGRAFVPILAISLVLLLSVPSSTVAGRAVGSGGASSAGSALRVTTPLPAALAAPLSARAGYISGWQGAVRDPVPVTGPVSLQINLWSPNRAMYAAGPTPSPIRSLAEFRATYDPAPSVYASYAQYLTAYGLRVGPPASDGLSFTASGSAAQVGRAFGTTIETGFEGPEVVQFPAEPPVLPAALGSATAAIVGLASGWAHASFSLQIGQQTETLITPSAARDAYELSGLYNISGGPHWATGTQVALVLWGDGYDPNDLATFFSQYYPASFPQPHIFAYPVNGAPSPSGSAVSDPSMAPTELTLDLEWSGSMAPDSTLDAVYGPDGPASNRYSPSDFSLEQALTTAENLQGVDVVSMSFATSDGSDTSLQAAFESTFASGTAKGITFVAASGDNGGTNGTNGACTSTPDPEYPAASPQVVAVGGTAPTLSVSLTGTVTGIQSEPAWKDSGGGTSIDYSAPGWQPAGMRQIPDIAGPASSNFVYFGGQTEVGNGTSFAAPFWGGMIAEMDAIHGSPFGNLAPRLYSIGEAEPNGSVAPGLADITAGSNCLGPATAGWDSATGWGTPRGLYLYEDLNAPYVDISLTLAAGTISPGQSLTVDVLVTNASSHIPLPGLVVSFSFAASSGYLGPCGGTFSTGTASTDPGGAANSSLSLPGCFLGSQGEVTATVESGGYFGTSSASVQVNLEGWNAFLQFIEQYPYNYLTFAVIMVAAIGIGLAISGRAARRRAAAQVRTARPSPPTGATRTFAPGGTAPSSPTGTTGLSQPAAAPVAATLCAHCGAPLDPQLPFCARCGQYVTPPGETAGYGQP
jgi:kumamolisin